MVLKLKYTMIFSMSLILLSSCAIKPIFGLHSREWCENLRNGQIECEGKRYEIRDGELYTNYHSVYEN